MRGEPYNHPLLQIMTVSWDAQSNKEKLYQVSIGMNPPVYYPWTGIQHNKKEILNSFAQC